jgi:hypothetical protein
VRGSPNCGARVIDTDPTPTTPPSPPSSPAAGVASVLAATVAGAATMLAGRGAGGLRDST